MESALEARLLNEFQRDFPLVEAPFAAMAQSLGVRESTVLECLDACSQQGKISRVGPVFAPQRVGVSTLVAMAVPGAKLVDVAACVSSFPGVNHNYEREHHFNLWFVATAADQTALETTLSAISASTGYEVLPLPLLEAFHIDLGFCLQGKPSPARLAPPPHSAVQITSPAVLQEGDRVLIASLQAGIPLVSHPFAAIANSCGLAESEVLAQLQRWLIEGVIKRFGVIVRHHELGFTANAMLVHDLPDDAVTDIGQALAKEPAVTLCYRRPRRLPEWRHNLFCMIHGRERGEVEAIIQRIRESHGLTAYPHEILFSKTRFKQSGARYA